MAARRVEVNLTPRMEQFQKRLTYRALRDVLRHYAIAVWRGSARNAPVRTGYLRSSIGYTVRPSAAVVRATAPYAGHQEFGTGRMRGKRYMRRAVEQANRLLPSFFERAIEKWL